MEKSQLARDGEARKGVRRYPGLASALAMRNIKQRSLSAPISTRRDWPRFSAEETALSPGIFPALRVTWEFLRRPPPLANSDVHVVTCIYDRSPHEFVTRKRIEREISIFRREHNFYIIFLLNYARETLSTKLSRE